jgi:hypothetical protein
MIRYLYIAFFLLIVNGVEAQYYYQDIFGSATSRKNFLLLKENKIKKVEVSSIEADGNETEGFGISQTVNAAANKLTTVTKSTLTGLSTLTTKFNSAGYPEQLIDSSINTVNVVNYLYDKEGKLQKLSSYSRDPEDTNKYTVSEDHLFTYNNDGKLVSMLRIKDRIDTLLVRFILAEEGLPGEEQWWKNNRKIENWFYYYNEKGQLTDVVRYNKKYKQMIPDYVFEYNDAGQIKSQTVVQPGTSFFRLWMYEYNANGLKKAETIFNKGKEQEARILYDYE